MSDPIEITIDGADKIVKALSDFPEQIRRNFQQAGDQAAKEVLNTQGLQRYPPVTEANMAGRYSLRTQQRMGHYVRGTGAVTPGGKQLFNSEKYGTQFYIKHNGFGVVIGNRASYAKYLTDEKQQSRVMEKYGWRKLIDVAREKMSAITTIYNKWVEYTINKLGL